MLTFVIVASHKGAGPEKSKRWYYEGVGNPSAKPKSLWTRDFDQALRIDGVEESAQVCDAVKEDCAPYNGAVYDIYPEVIHT